MNNLLDNPPGLSNPLEILLSMDTDSGCDPHTPNYIQKSTPGPQLQFISCEFHSRTPDVIWLAGYRTSYLVAVTALAGVKKKGENDYFIYLFVY